MTVVPRLANGKVDLSAPAPRTPDGKLHQLLVPDADLLEYYCQENEKDEHHMVGK